jgi:hypothetical protein
MRKHAQDTAAKDKKEIQRLVREIVILRDGGCVLRGVRLCGGEVGKAVLQADHLITRANSATFADTRLIVCLCRPCHGGYKQWHKEKYDALVKTVLDVDTVKLWERCQEDSWRPQKQDWKMHIVLLKKELELLNKS